MGKVFDKYKHLGTTEYVCATCSSTFSVVTCFDTKKHELGVRFCGKPCWYTYKSKNKITWNKGLKGVMKPNSGSFKKGEHRSKATEFKKGVLVGPKNNLWRGGKTPLNVCIRNLEEYKTWRTAVFTRDNFTCVSCERRGVKLHADHIKSFISLLNEFLEIHNQFSPVEDKETLLRLATKHEPFWNVSNGRTLCVDCHKLTETYLKRPNQLV